MNKMMIVKTLARFVHTNAVKRAAEKSNLALLRKKTGYTFANCKKALELHNNELAKAEIWLKEQAKTLGWSKATKLEGRQTTQGLVGVLTNQQTAVLIEVNCETDFVAKNVTFQDLVSEVANTCLQFTEKQSATNGPLTKIGLDAEQLKNLKNFQGVSLSDKVALMIGAVGENATLRRGFCLKVAEPSVRLFAYAHPSGNVKNDVMLGRVASIVAVRQIQPNQDEASINEIGRGLCQHIVGMNPKRIGSPDDQPAKDSDDEECLIHQEYLQDETVTVKEVLEESGLEVIQFKRFECGEIVNTTEQPLELIKTCQ